MSAPLRFEAYDPAADRSYEASCVRADTLHRVLGVMIRLADRAQSTDALRADLLEWHTRLTNGGFRGLVDVMTEMADKAEEQ